MTNENDNDQFTNNQLDGRKDRTDCLYRFSLVIGHYLPCYDG
jgi:hypothetical protein